MKRLFTTFCVVAAACAAYAQPKDVPAVQGDDVYQLYVNGGHNEFNFYDWGGGKGAAETIDGKQVYKISEFKYFGSGFKETDASNKKFYHIDVYPMQDMELSVVMINWKSDHTSNDGEKGYNIPALKANEWNSIDIPVQH